MKRLAKLFITTLIILAFTCIAYADELEATVVYTADDSYIVEIPETIVVGEPSYITVSDMDVANNKVIFVTLSGGANEMQIYNQRDTSRPLNVYFTDENGIRASATTSVAMFWAEGTKEFTAVVENEQDAIAGEYTGSVMFDISCR